ncbi:tryptophan halogenase family protein [Shewanella sp. CG12_big_fil_rev_8_21_14_0_65_47_15]|uniref:tryptophan halogenase family protein n=1 Tax=Shewanella sp. CG12_big_fil_rev_8_21_14_0_65_47_15 TaxID=1975537 RepID=UPI000CC82647|nr:tryptophan halogenase family protein [Shewanella sp. CG12_big_fil_rev_8_21_14_0_65_47_15]PIW59904.1 MAG: tryptophan halogenase [Shewanella sp. CG12_big_fil_rev_8_21_14_0_65_47_15]
MNYIKNIIIVGGGTSGWMTAAMLAKLFKSTLNITLIESEDIGTIGVGEATIPPLQIFNNVLGINEADFINATQATFKLGIQFENWGKPGEAYMHAFGHVGKDIGFTQFHHYWLSTSPKEVNSFWDYSVNYQAAKHNKFQVLQHIPNSPLAGLTHAYHFDATLYAQFLRRFSEQLGVKRIEGKVISVDLAPCGKIDTVKLQTGQVIAADFFVDCSGFAALLIEKALKVDFDSYQHWLPCDRAYAVPCEKTTTITPYTRSIAHDVGWQWRIPLQHRTGNGLVYCSRYVSDDAAKQLLLDNLDGKPLAEPKKINFTTGRRLKQWHKNCVAIGLSSGFLEPLESTSLHLVQSAIIRLSKLFPHQGIAQANVDEFNHQSKLEFEQIRDFIILHYHLNQRVNSQENSLWQQCQTMEIPDSLQQKIELFRETGAVFRHQEELFTEAAWVQVMLGQGIMPQDFNPLSRTISASDLAAFLQNMRTIIDNAVGKMPTHNQYLAHLG